MRKISNFVILLLIGAILLSIPLSSATSVGAINWVTETYLTEIQGVVLENITTDQTSVELNTFIRVFADIFMPSGNTLNSSYATIQNPNGIETTVELTPYSGNTHFNYYTNLGVLGTYNITFVNATDNESVNSEYTAGKTFTVVERSTAPGSSESAGGGGGVTPPLVFGKALPFAISPQTFKIESILGDTEVRELVLKNTMEDTPMNKFERIQIRLMIPVDGAVMQVPALYQYTQLSPQKEVRIPITFKVPNQLVTKKAVLQVIASYQSSSESMNVPIEVTGITCKKAGNIADRREECCSFLVENGKCASKLPGPISVQQEGIMAFLLALFKWLVALLESLLG